MLNFITLIIFINFPRATFTQEPITVLEKSVQSENEAAQLLTGIQSNEALPLVLFETIKTGTSTLFAYQLMMPEEMEKAVILHKRMIQGTEFRFFTETIDSQIFYCPKPNSQEKCLSPQSFEGNEPLQCVKEPISILKQEQISDYCGPHNSGTPYNIIYKICPSEENHIYLSDEIEMYAICYNANTRKTLYTVHIILSPNLLKSNLLYRERNVPYSFIKNEELEPVIEAMDLTTETDLNLLTHPRNPAYGIQKLVPDTDMAFALWRKSTHQSFNLDWQHKTLIPLWNKINDYVKIKAVRMLLESTELRVKTAVFEIAPASADDTKISTIWIKIITTVSKKYSFIMNRGIAILMNNFITDTTHESVPNPAEEAITKFCVNDFCKDSFRAEFENVGGRVLCCTITRDIAEVFGIQNLNKNIPILNIRGITF